MGGEGPVDRGFGPLERLSNDVARLDVRDNHSAAHFPLECPAARPAPGASFISFPKGVAAVPAIGSHRNWRCAMPRTRYCGPVREVRPTARRVRYGPECRSEAPPSREGAHAERVEHRVGEADRLRPHGEAARVAPTNGPGSGGGGAASGAGGGGGPRKENTAPRSSVSAQFTTAPRQAGSLAPAELHRGAAPPRTACSQFARRT